MCLFQTRSFCSLYHFVFMSRSTNFPFKFSWIQPQSIVVANTSDQIPFELFSDNLHLPPPEPRFNFIPLQRWYTGFPLSAMAVVKNNRENPIFSPQLTIQAKDQHGKLLEQNAPAILSLEPKKKIAIRVSLLPPRESHIEVTCTFKYVESNGLTINDRKKLEIDIIQPIALEYKSFPQASNLMQFTITNMSPFILYNVYVSTDANESFVLPKRLNPNDTFSGILNITKPHTSLTASYTPQNFPRTFTTIPCIMQRHNTSSLIKVSLENIPKEWPSMKPFKVTLHIKNISFDKILSGRVAVAELNDSIFVFGNNDLTFKAIKPNEIGDVEIEFIAVKQGAYKFPAFDFYIGSFKSFRINNEAGILVVGIDQR